METSIKGIENRCEEKVKKVASSIHKFEKQVKDLEKNLSKEIQANKKLVKKVDALKQEIEVKIAKQVSESLRKIKDVKNDAVEKEKEEISGDSESKLKETLINACEKDSKKFYNERKQCEVSLTDQKCDLCNFATHSKGLLKMHESNDHEKRIPFKDILYGFEVDEVFFKILIDTMYEGEDKDIPSFKCGTCSFNSYGEGALEIHKLKEHEQRQL